MPELVVAEIRGVNDLTPGNTLSNLLNLQNFIDLVTFPERALLVLILISHLLLIEYLPLHGGSPFHQFFFLPFGVNMLSSFVFLNQVLALGQVVVWLPGGKGELALLEFALADLPRNKIFSLI